MAKFYADNWRPERRHYLALSFGAYCREFGVTLDDAMSLVVWVARAGGEEPGFSWGERQQAVAFAYSASIGSFRTGLARFGLALPPFHQLPEVPAVRRPFKSGGP